ncbi:unnamed protein product, partial [Staurois parvus]
MYTDHQSTDDQCALMISVAPAVPPVSAHQCLMPVHINATYQCPSELPFRVTQCQSVPPINAYQCCQSVPPISESQCHLLVPVSAAYQCHVSVLPFSAHHDACQCPSVPPTSASSSVPIQCHLSVSISAAYQCPSV